MEKFAEFPYFCEYFLIFFDKIFLYPLEIRFFVCYNFIKSSVSTCARVIYFYGENAMATYHVLYNPKAANGQGCQNAKALDEILEGDTLVYVDVSKVDYPAFFASLKKKDRIIVAGGDGTLNKFLNDTADIDRTNSLYYFACGTGNDFMHDIGAAIRGKPVCIDQYVEDLPQVIVKGKSYYFINGIGYGIDGYCCEVGDKQRESSTKPVNYTAIAIKGLLFHYKTTKAKIIVDGVTREYKKVWLAPTMNGRFYGGGMIPTPEQDRLSEAGNVSTMVYYGVGKLKALMVFPSIFKGEHVKHKKMVEILTGDVVTVEFDRPTPLQIDGETITDVTEYTVLSRKALKEAKKQKKSA